MTTTGLKAQQELVDKLLNAQLGAYEIDLLSETYPLTVKESYEVQLKLVARLVERGAGIVGLKTGLTSPAKQAAMGVHEPCYGYILDNTLIEEGQPFSLAGLIHPRAEPELAFVLGRPLQGPGVNAEQVMAATAEIRLALEVIDSRYRNFNFTLTDVIADNCSSGKLLLSKKAFPPTAYDLSSMALTLERNGIPAQTGTGAAVMGHPANAVAWLANKRWEIEGRGLEAGNLVLAGAFTPAVELKPGDSVKASFAGVGELILTCLK